MNLTEYIDSKHEEHLNELYEFLRIPSVSAQSEHKPDIERAAKWVAEKLRAADLDNVENPADENGIRAGVRRIAELRARPASRRSSSTDTTMCSRLSRWSCGHRRPSSRPSATEICTPAAPPTTKGRCTSTSARSTPS